MDISDNDYAEGAWTPVITGTTAAGAGTYVSQSGAYVKIGKFVHVNGILAWSAHDGTGNMTITGLPFAQGGSTVGVISFAVSSLTQAAALQGRISGSTIVLETQASNASAVALPMDAAATIRFSANYMAAS